MSTSFDAFVDSLLETEVEIAIKPTNLVKYPCGQCAGTGAYQGARVHQEKSHCFACRGLGYFKSSPEARLKHRLAAKARAQNKLEVALAAFSEHEPAMFADLLDARKHGTGSDFIGSLAAQLFQRGTLSDKQVAAWHRGKARLAEIRAEAAARAEASKVEGVDLSAIRVMFDTAAANGLQKPAYRAEGLVLKAAPAHGRNAGALYVTSAEDAAYLGKLVGTTFHPVGANPAPVEAALRVIASNPKEAAVAYGRRTGVCACCGRKLTDAKSVELGIGPICIQKWGF